jgi:hypothetical protein
MQARPTAPSPPLAEDLAPARNRLGAWPVGLLIVVALRILDAIAMAAVGLGVTGLPVSGLPILANAPNLTRAIELIWAVGTIVGVVGLLTKRRWGWVLTMVLVGLGLLSQLIRVAIGQPDYLNLLLLVVSAFYLNQRSVRVMARQYLDDDVA